MKKKATAKEPRPAKSARENAPYCKLCETRHYLREPHAFTKAAKEKRNG